MGVKGFGGMWCNMVLGMICFVFRVLSIGGGERGMGLKIVGFGKWGCGVVGSV